jgi:hypothetical protein
MWRSITRRSPVLSSAKQKTEAGSGLRTHIRRRQQHAFADIFAGSCWRLRGGRFRNPRRSCLNFAPIGMKYFPVRAGALPFGERK